jgi:autotransporter-associated beta strand protein
LTGVSTYQGTTTISNGAVEVGGAGQLAGGNYTGAVSLVTNSSSLRVNSSANQILSGAISGSGALAKSANGTLTLSGSNSYSGGTTISGGRVIATSTNALGDASSAITVSGAAYLQLATNITRTGEVTFDGGYISTSNGSSLTKNGGNYVLTNAAEIVAGLGGTAGLTRGGTGVSVLWSSNSYTGATVVTGGSLRLDGTGNISGSSALQVDSGATFSMTGQFLTSNNVTVAGLTGAGTVFGGAGSFTVNKSSGSDTFSGGISGGIGLSKSGIGTLILSGSNSYTGATTISSGTLLIANGKALGATNSGTTVSDGAILRFVATDNNGLALVGEAVTLVGGSNTNASLISTRLTNSITPTNTFQGKITLLDDARIDSLGGTTLVLTNASNVIESANNADLTFSGAGNTRLNSAISIGTGSVTKNGSGVLYVAGNGTLGGLGSGVVLNSGNIDLEGGSLTNASFTITAGVLTNGTLTATSYNLNGGSVRASLGAGTVNAASGTTSVTNGGSLGAATVNVTGGTLNLGSAGLLASNVVVTVNSGQITLGGNETIGALAGSGGTVALGANSLTTGGANTSTTFGGVLTGSGVLTKAGLGTLTLTGLNTYSGGTFLNGGWLTAGHTNAFGTGSITVGSGTTLNLTNFVVSNHIVNNGGTVLSTGQLSDVTATNGTTDIGGNNSTITEVGGSATVNVSGTSVTVNQATGGTLNISGSDARVATLSGGTVNANAAGLVVTNFNGGSIAVSNGLTVGLRGGSSSGVISGSGGMAKQGADTLTLSANNTYTGATTVEAGKLVVNGSISSSAVTVQSGAVLGGSGTVGSLTLNGILAPGNSAGTTTVNGNASWNQGSSYDWEIYNLAGPAGTGWDLLSVTGGGTLSLSGISVGGFTINLITLSSNNSTRGSLTNFDPTASYTGASAWMIANAATITGFDPNKFNFNDSLFVGATGTFAIEQRALDGGGQGLFVTYAGGGAAVPEPGTWAAGGLLAVLAAGAAWRRKMRTKSVLPVA